MSELCVHGEPILTCELCWKLLHRMQGSSADKVQVTKELKRGRKPMAPELKKRQVSLTLKPETIRWLQEQADGSEVLSQTLDRLVATWVEHAST